MYTPMMTPIPPPLPLGSGAVDLAVGMGWGGAPLPLLPAVAPPTTAFLPPGGLFGGGSVELRSDA